MRRLHQRTREVREQIAEGLVGDLSPHLRKELVDAHWSDTEIFELKQLAIQAIKERIR